MSMDESEEESGGAGWIVSYADLMTLLFAAFVVLYGTIQEGKSERVMGAAAAIREAFKEIPDIIAEDQKIGDVAAGKFVFKAFKGETIAPMGPKQLKIKSDQTVAIDRDKNRVENLINRMAKTKNKFDSRLRRAISVESDEAGFKIKLVGAYFYKPGEHKLSREARDRLIELGYLLKDLRRKIVIEGHTDSESDKKQDEATLGSLRAGYVARIFIKDAVLSPGSLRSISFGSSRPIAQSSDEQARNRRVEIKVLYKTD